MDPRCPLSLDDYPTTWCKLAVLRLKGIQNSNGNLTEAQEEKLPGCPWAIFDLYSHYCFFQYMRDKQEQPSSEAEVSSLLGIPQPLVHEAYQSAFEKYKESDLYTDIEYSYGSDSISDEFEPQEQGFYI